MLHLLGLLDSEDGGYTIPRNVGNCHSTWRNIPDDLNLRGDDFIVSLPNVAVTAVCTTQLCCSHLCCSSLFPLFLQLYFPAVPHEMNAVSSAG